MRRMQMLRIFAGYGRLDSEEVGQALRELLPVLEAEDLPELTYPIYSDFAHISEDREAALDWERRAREAAERQDDPLLAAWAKADRLTFVVRYRLQEESVAPQLRQALATFEGIFPTGFPVFSLTESLSAEYQRLGLFEEALAYGRRSLNIAKGWRDLFWIGIGADRLADVYQETGQSREARLQLLDVLEWHLAIGQVWQTMGFLWAKCVWSTEMLGELHDIVAILSMVHHHADTTPFHRQGTAEARDQFEPQMGREAFETAWDEGKRMSFETAVELMRDMLLRP